MVNSAKLYIIGHETEKTGIDVFSCDFGFIQGYDRNMKPNSEVQSNPVIIAIEAVSGNEIIQWMLSRDSEKKVRIVFSEKSDSKPFQEIKMIGARLISYSQNYQSKQVILTLSLAVRAMNISGVIFKNNWVGFESESLGPEDWKF
jgi:hypothetical protein